MIPTIQEEDIKIFVKDQFVLDGQIVAVIFTTSSPKFEVNQRLDLDVAADGEDLQAFKGEYDVLCVKPIGTRFEVLACLPELDDSEKVNLMKFATVSDKNKKSQIFA